MSDNLGAMGMSDLISAFLCGCIVMSILCSWMHCKYKDILVMNAKTKSAESINGKFYYIIPEEEFNK